MKLLNFVCMLLFEVLVLGICKELVADDGVTEGKLQEENKFSNIQAKQELAIFKSTTDANKLEEGSRAHSKEGPLIQKTKVLVAAFRSFRSHIVPIVSILSSLMGFLVIFFLIESPLSPLPVPPLPNSPVGPYPPTGKYPLGIPPPHQNHKYSYSAVPPPHQNLKYSYSAVLPPHQNLKHSYSAAPSIVHGYRRSKAMNRNFVNLDVPAMSFRRQLNSLQNFVNLNLSEHMISDRNPIS